MFKLLTCVRAVLLDVMYATIYFVKNNMYNVAVLMEIALPYVMMKLSCRLYEVRQGEFIGGEIFIPIVVLFACSVIKRYSNKSGLGMEIPVPRKRFTKANGDMVEVEPEDFEEMLLYMYEVEEYLERTGKDR